MNRDSLELSAPYVAPSSASEKTMTAIWSNVFDLEAVGLEDDFFELGGDSLLAASLVGAVKAEFQSDLKESQLADLNTPRKLLSAVDKSSSSDHAILPSNVIAINPDGRRAPIFLIHGAAGIVFLKPRFRDALDPEQPVYIFQAQGYDGAAPPLASVEEIASGYLRSILQVQPEPPWHMVAFCAGGWIAVEIVQQMQRQGRQPATVVLVDTNLPSGMRKDYSLKRIRIGNVHLPEVPDFLVGMMKGSLAMTRRVKIFFNTGRFKDVHDSRAIEDPAIRRYLVSSTWRRNKRRGASLPATLAASDPGDPQAQQADELAGIYSSEAAAITSAMLRRAYRAYRPSPCDFPFSFIVSVKRSAPFDDPEFPINRLLPNRRVAISGDTHGDAVSSRETALLIQRLVDGEAFSDDEPARRPALDPANDAAVTRI